MLPQPSDYNGNNYTPEEMSTYREEVSWLHRVWNEYVDRAYNGNDGLHPPPSMATLLQGIMNTNNPIDPIGELIAVDGTTADHATEVVQRTMANLLEFADAMFEFGQLCMQRGLLHANLTRCKCLEVTDQDLERFFNKEAP